MRLVVNSPAPSNSCTMGSRIHAMICVRKKIVSQMGRNQCSEFSLWPARLAERPALTSRTSNGKGSKHTKTESTMARCVSGAKVL